MKKINNFLNGLKDYVGESYFDSWFVNNWDQLVLILGLFASLFVFIKSDANLLLTIMAPFAGLLVFQVIKLPVFIVKFFYNVLRDLMNEEVSFLYFYKN